MGEILNAKKISVGKSEGKGSLPRPKGRREDNIKTDLIEVGCEGSNSSGYGPMAGLYEDGNEPSLPVKGAEVPNQMCYYQNFTKFSTKFQCSQKHLEFIVKTHASCTDNGEENFAAASGWGPE
jgi:hypothetical protein